MESILDEARRRMDQAGERPEALLDYQPEIKKLAKYYASSNWKKDFALDEEGLLPKDLKRGVLSEDGIYDVLERNKELIADRRKTMKRDAVVTKVRKLAEKADVSNVDFLAVQVNLTDQDPGVFYV